MALSNDLISQFVKITKDKQDAKKETVVYGTIHKDVNGNENCVNIDGSNISTPVSKTVVANEGDRVTVMIKNHTATVTGNLSNPSARVIDTVTIENLNASNARIDTLDTANVNVQNTLTAHEAKIQTLEATDVEITGRLSANEADIKHLKALDIDTEKLNAAYAFVEDLEASHADVDYLVSTVADIDTLIFGSAEGDIIQTSFSNAVIAQLGDAQIKSAMIESVSANKITAGDIITNNVRVKSEDGSLIISDETLQISDKSRVRVQIGKDAANDYSINIWDQNGNLMFSRGGITDAAIKEAIIRNDMVSDTANIHASKLDVDSLFEEINDSSNTIKSSKVYLDDKKQTLDVAFKSLTTDITNQGKTITSQGTAISTIQGQISSKVWQQDIDTATDEMSTQYSTLEQKIDGISSKVASNTTAINKKANSTTVTTIANSVTSLEQDLNGFKTTVSETYATQIALDSTEEKIDNAKLGNLVRNGYGEYLDNTNFTNATFTRGDAPEGCYGYFTNGMTEYIPFNPNKIYNYEYFCRLHEGVSSGSSYFCIIPYDVDGNEIGSQHVLNYNENLFYLKEDLKDGDTVAYFENLIKWNTNTTQSYQRSFLIFNYVDSTGYVYPDGVYSRNTWLSVYSDDSSVDKTNHTISLTTAWSGGTIPAGTCIGQTASGSTYCYYGQNGTISNTDWNRWTGKIYAGSTGGDIDKKSRRLTPAKTIRISIQYTRFIADYTGIYLAEETIDTSARERLSSAESSIVQLSNSITSTVSEISSLDTRVSSTESSITQLSNSISANITETTSLGTRMTTVEQTAEDLSVKLDDLTIGGRNLLLNSSFSEDLTEWAVSGDVVITEKYGKKCAHISQTALTENKFVRQSILSKLEPNTTYKISGWILTENVVKGTTNYMCQFYTSGSYDKDGTSTWFSIGTLSFPINVGEWTRVETTLVTDTVKFPSATSLNMFVYSRDMIGDVYFADLKLEKGDKATDWTPAPEDIDSDISDIRDSADEAAKTATNYLNFSSNGLIVGDMTASTLGKNVLIDSDSVDIRNGTTTLASFGASTIYLGKNNDKSVINLCNGSATMTAVDDTDFRIYSDKRLVMSAYQSMLLDCRRDATHMTRIAIQSSDPDQSSVVGGVQFTIYQDDIQNTVQMLGNDIILKVTDGTDTSRITLQENAIKLYSSGKLYLNSESTLQIGESSSYSYSVVLGNTYNKAKSIGCYWNDGESHDLITHAANGQNSFFGPSDISITDSSSLTSTTNIRGKYIRLYNHSGGGVYLGSSGSTAVTSDRNLKKDILDIDNKYLDFFDRLRPITYKYNCPENKGHRDHVGFVAQEIEEALTASGLTTEQFAGLVIERDVTLNPNYNSSLSDEENAANETHYDTLYSLRYEEFISLLVKKVQSLQEQIDQLRADK